MHFRLNFLTDEEIQKRSSGEIVNTSLFRGKKPITGGLYCERVFGPIKDWTCGCGRLQGRDHRGEICEACGVIIAPAAIRSRRAGHISFPVYLVHPLGMSCLAKLFSVSYYALQEFLLTKTWGKWEPSSSGKVLSQDGERVKLSFFKTSQPGAFLSSAGLWQSLQELDWKKTVEEFPNRLRNTWLPSQCFLSSIPVLSPFYRPEYTAPDGKVISHDFTYQYQLILRTKNKLARLSSWSFSGLEKTKLTDFPTILHFGALELQNQINTLFLGQPVKKTRRGRELASILGSLTGKFGWIRHYMYGKRVDYSGRSVITSDPRLSVEEVGLPYEMAYELFRPHIIGLLRREQNIKHKQGERLVDEQHPLAQEALERLIEFQFVLLNRAPTLHRGSIMAFKPQLREEKNITLSPLITAPFNYDVDGDTMAVHVPLSTEAKKESWDLLRAEKNILSDLNSSPVILPSHESLLGIAELSTIDNSQALYPTKKSLSETLYELGVIRLNTPLLVNGMVTSLGRLRLEDILGISLEKTITKTSLRTVLSKVYDKFGAKEFCQRLEKLKDVGYQHITSYGFSFGWKDIYPPSTREHLFEEAQREVEEILQSSLSEEAKKAKIILIWDTAFSTASRDFLQEISKENSLFKMVQSGARVSQSQVNQLAIAKGLQASASGDILLPPILSSLAKGLSTHEFFQTCSGARKSMYDKKSATPLAGYLAQQLVHLLRDFYIVSSDCQTTQGLCVPRKEARGRYTLSGEKIPWEEQTSEMIEIRSPVFCIAKGGLCQRCYGDDPTTRKEIKIGSAVGIITGQALSEPATQLSLRSFHTSGNATVRDSTIHYFVPEDTKVRISYPSESSEYYIAWCYDLEYTYYFHKDYSRIFFPEGISHMKKGELLGEYYSDTKNKDISGKLPQLLALLNGTAKNPALIAAKDGVIHYTALGQRLQIFQDEQELAIIDSSIPLLVPSGKKVKKGEFLTPGVFSLKTFPYDIPLSAALFTSQIRLLYQEEGIFPLSVHLELLFRGLSEIVTLENGQEHLFRFYSNASRKIYGLTTLLRRYPSWMKGLPFGYVRETLVRALEQHTFSLDLPTERLLYTKFPLHNSQFFS